MPQRTIVQDEGRDQVSKQVVTNVRNAEQKIKEDRMYILYVSPDSLVSEVPY
jgi:hypothetical protein